VHTIEAKTKCSVKVKQYVTYVSKTQLHLSIQNLCLLPEVKKKGKAIPLQVWTGPEGYRGLRLPDFKTITT